MVSFREKCQDLPGRGDDGGCLRQDRPRNPALGAAAVSVVAVALLAVSVLVAVVSASAAAASVVVAFAAALVVAAAAVAAGPSPPGPRSALFRGPRSQRRDWHLGGAPECR